MSPASPAAASAERAVALPALLRQLRLPQEQPSKDPQERRWSLAALRGHLCELNNSGRAPALSFAASLILEAQQRGEPTAWVSATASSFYPPDLAGWGIDLDALAVIRVEGAKDAARAADHLLRSGAIGMVVLDLGPHADLLVPMQTRLLGLARRHHALLLCLTQSTPGRLASLGSLVSLRASATLQPTDRDGFLCVLRAEKDKRNGPGWEHRMHCRGPEGLL